MKSWIAATAIFALAACTPPAEQAQPAEAQRPVDAASGAYTLDPHHTTITALVPHMGLSAYQLRFNRVSGELNFNAEDPTQSNVNVSIDMTSLDTPFTAPTPDFDQELQSADWLDSGAHPTATFSSTSIESTGPNSARVTGDLTFHGVTHPATLEVTYNGSLAQHPMGMDISIIGFSARGSLQRSQFGVSRAMPSAPDANDGVGDEVELIIETEFTKENDPASATPAAE